MKKSNKSREELQREIQEELQQSVIPKHGGLGRFRRICSSREEVKLAKLQHGKIREKDFKLHVKPKV